MLKTIIRASENFCIHQIRVSHSVSDIINKKRTLIAYIDIQTIEPKKFRIYLASDLGFMQKISKVFLEEDESDEETLIDMTLETTNLIIGSAKVLAQSTGESFTIATPYFEKIDIFDFDFDDAKSIKIDGDEMVIAIKEIQIG